MGLFDHLFKPKPEPAGEEIVEAEAVASESQAGGEPTAHHPSLSRPDPTTFLHPKNFIPRAGSPILPAPKSPLASTARFNERKLGPSVVPATNDEIVLTLGDILSRIPPHYLKSGTHDPKRELRFKINDLSSDIARGRAAVSLSSVARLLPDLFVKEIAPDEDTEVRLPLQKLVEQIGLLRSRPATPAPDKTPLPAPPPPAHRLSPALETPTLMENVVAPVFHPPESAPARETLRELRPDAEKADELRRFGESLRESFFAAGKAEEAAPAAENPVLAHVPQVESHASTVVPEATKETVAPPKVLVVPPRITIPEATKVAEVPLEKAVDFSGPAPAEPAPVAPKPPQVEVLASSFAQALAVESEKRAGAVIEKPAESASVPEQPAVPPAVSVAGSVASSVPVEPPDARPGGEPTQEPAPAAEIRGVTESRIEPEGMEERIHLSLAAILRQCPRELIVGQLPHVDDSIRITLPFAPIDRQLNTGKVEVSAMRFVAALPPRFQKFFTTTPDLKVPIPLEEVFQNLPAPGAEIGAPAEELPGLILAPATEMIPPTPVPAETPEAVVEPAPAIPQETVAAPPEPAPAPAEAMPELSQTALVEKPAAESSPSPSDAIPLAVEPAATIPSSGSEIGFEATGQEEVKPGLHLPAFHVFTPPPPLVTLAGFDFTSAETSTLSEQPAPVVSEEKVEAAPLPEAIPAGPAAAAGPASIEDEATQATQAPTESGSVTGVQDAALEQQMEDVPVVVAAVAPAPMPEHQQEDVAGVESSSPPASISGGTAASPSDILGSKLEASAPADALGINAAPTKTIVPPQMIRPHIMPPPPLFGFTPGAETPAVETPAADHEVPVEKNGLDSDFKLLWYDDTEKTKVISDELLGAPLPVSQPDPAQPELFHGPQLSAEAADGFVASPDAQAPSALGETGAQISGETPPQTAAVETEGSPLAMPADSPKQVSPAESLPKPPTVEQVAGEVTPSETTSGHAVSIVESGLISAEVVPPGESVVPEVATPVAAESEIKPDGVQVAEVIPPLEEDWVARQAAESAKAETKPPEPEPAPEPEQVAPIEEVPAGDGGEFEAAVPIIPPLPLPLLPLPRLEPSFGLSEVIPPPALQLKRLDQDALQAIFMTDETLDLPKISRLAATLPGVYACVIATRDQAITGGNLPDGFDLAALLGLAPRIREAASRMPIGALKHFTIYGESYSISFFERRGLSLCAIHRARSFVPGVREKLVAIADELSQM